MHPGARSVDIEEVTYALPIESPEIINRLLAEHLTAVTRLIVS